MCLSFVFFIASFDALFIRAADCVVNAKYVIGTVNENTSQVYSVLPLELHAV